MSYNNIVKFAAMHNFRVVYRSGDWPLFGGRCSSFLQGDGKNNHIINILDVLNGTRKGAEEILWCMAAAYLHGDKGNTITREDRNELDKENERAMRLAMELYEFMKPENPGAAKTRRGKERLCGTGILIPFPARSGDTKSAPTPAN
jgi:hypothetical protein